jgi:hypothetical protein
MEQTVTGHQTCEQGLGLVEHHQLTIQMGHRPPRLFYEQSAGADIPLVFRDKRESGIGFSAGDKGEFVRGAARGPGLKEGLKGRPFSPLRL